MLLSEIFPGQPETEITGICMDSRKVRSGNIFFCIKGLEADGHAYAEAAVKAGAVAVVYSEPDLKVTGSAVYIMTDDVGRELNRAADIFYGHPSKGMTVFGVTGTNGKSTTTSVISDIWNRTGRPCGYMGTISVRYGDYSRKPSLTTPDAIEIHSTLKEMKDHGMQGVAMEVSSHGLALGRVDTVDFDVAVFTNLTYDHLDFHKTMENYFEAKKLLFRHMKKDGVAVINADDEASYEGLKECCSCRAVSYGIDNEADYRAENLEISSKGTRFILNVKGTKYDVSTNLVAKYNIHNLLGAIAAMHETGMSIEEMLPYLGDIRQVDGRMEIIDGGQDFNLIVDYAHTPDGFDKIFEYAESIKGNGSISAVFGCAGKRDKVKRKILGEIASGHCERIYVTEEDPRTESAEEIGAEIMSGIEEGKGVFIKDRFMAIEKAVKDANAGDCVLILGKGDEEYMYYGTGRVPWMGDNEAARQALKERMYECRL